MRTSSARAKGTKELIAHYFEAQEDGNTYKCKARHCNKLYKQKQGTGYTNLKNHLQTCIGFDYEKRYVTEVHPASAHLFEDKFKDEPMLATPSASPSPSSQAGGAVGEAVDKKMPIDTLVGATSAQAGNEVHKEMFRWIEWLVGRGIPPTEVENPTTRRAMRIGRVSQQAVRKCMLNMVLWVQMAMTEILPKNFGIVIDSWTEERPNREVACYLAVFATFMSKGAYEEVLLRVSPPFSPVGESEELAKQHINFIRKSLATYNRELADVLVVVAETSETNKLISSELGVPLVGSVHARFDLAVSAYLTKDEDIKAGIAKIEQLVELHRKVEMSSGQHGVVSMVFPPVENDMMIPDWQRTYHLLKRYFKFEASLAQPNMLAAVNISLNKMHRLFKILEHLDNFDSVAKNLQTRGLHLAETRISLDLIVEDYPEFGAYLSPNSLLIDDPMFESAVVKVINDNQAQLSTAEKEALRALEVRDAGTSSDTTETKGNGKSPTYAEKIEARKRQRLMANSTLTYMDPRFIPSSSAMLERTFGQPMRFVAGLRASVSPVLLDAYLYLQGNRKLWSLTTVTKALKSTDSEQTKLDDDTFYHRPLGWQ